MERSKKTRKRYGRYNNVEEPEYHVVEDQEEVLNVHIQPARPLYADREYADRDLLRSSPVQSPCSNSSGNSSTAPKCPPRETPIHPAPAVNRELKPGRWRTHLDERIPAVEPREQHTQLSQRTASFLNKLVNQISGLNLQQPKRDGQTESNNEEFSTPTSDESFVDSSSETDSANHTNLRYSLDLDAQRHEDKRCRSLQNLGRSSTKRQHHEWPQTKEDFDQHEFVAKEKPQKAYHEEDWYVGTCNRTEAEHALHLMNKDGAFLVRDCSKNTTSEPFVLAVYHERKVYNVKIRFIEKTGKYILGTGRRTNDMFDSVADIIKFHSIFPIVLITGRNMSARKDPGNCVLTCPITKNDVDQLLG